MNELEALLTELDHLPPAVQRQYRGARCLVDVAAMNQALDRLAVRVTLVLQDADPVLVAVGADGAELAGRLGGRMVFPCERAAIADSDGSVQPLVPIPKLQDRPVLLVGAQQESQLMGGAREWAASEGAAVCHQACAIAMQGEQADALVAIDDVNDLIEAGFADEPASDVHLFGVGISWQGYGHNLGGLYAVASGAGATTDD